MARKYNRLIRYYDSWFADLMDPSKELSAEECWCVILAIRDCQREQTTEPLLKLPLQLRRALSMATIVEQVERIIEKTSNMSERGRRGGMASQYAAAVPAAEPGGLKAVITPPDDGVERNLKGLLEFLDAHACPDDLRCSIVMASNYGEIGHKVWKILSRSHSMAHPVEYVAKALFS